ncbi:hypothetical protein GPECTOR_5g199 [Gonium pectorale]|uniref:Right handed beta helix domain-containing protein n=1 Tax=Gonium pectorale TaxID=33097 RepID=A0A150GWB0_GONPE|nr:hypothetical protein GPECTOR_5g199 [Gonium pectorale]|eukprot:KXZ54094.1 hypothetical protein GPECTOR_5g199 [Gonium pectorale]
MFGVEHGTDIHGALRAASCSCTRTGSDPQLAGVGGGAPVLVELGDSINGNADWRVTLRDVSHFRLEHSLLSGLPLSSLGPLVSCVNCKYLSTENVTLERLYGAAASTASPPHAVYGALHSSGLVAAQLSGLHCSGIRNACGWACSGLELAAPVGDAGGTAAVRVARSSFRDNSVIGPVAGVPSRGFGAILVLRSVGGPLPVDITVSDTELVGNQGVAGAALATVGIQAVNLTLEHSDLSGNTATDPSSNDWAATGGAVHIDGSLAALRILGSRVSDNTAGDGGAFKISAMAGAITIGEGSSVDNNTALLGGGGAFSVGQDVASLVLRNESSLSRNSAKTSNGGVLIARSLGALQLLSGSSMSHNAAGGSGGAAFIYGDPGHGSGGLALLVDGGSHIDNNTASRPYSRGGVVASRQSLVEVVVSNGSSISGNSAGSGGAFHTEQSVGALTVSSSSCLCRNTARDENGGAVCVEGRLQTVKVYGNSAVSANSASKSNGGAIFVRGPIDTLSVTDGSNLTSNVAGQRGGAVCSEGVPDGSTAAMAISIADRSRVDNNTAAMPYSRGGAFATRQSIASFAVSNGSSVSGNVAGSGGALSTEQSLGSLSVSSGSSVSENTALNEHGGAIFVDGLLGTVSVQDWSQLSYNRASKGSGGAVYSRGGLGALDVARDSHLSFNWAETRGGAVYADGAGQDVGSVLVADNSSISGNLAGQFGGALATSRGLASLTVTNNSRADNNSARDVHGGAVFVEQSLGSIVVSHHSSLSGNTAKLRGGGVYVQRNLTSVSIVGSSSVNNNSVSIEHGGAVAVGGWLAFLRVAEGSSLDGNAALVGGGGAVQVDQLLGSVVLDYGSSVSGNTASNSSGGAFALQSLGSLQLLSRSSMSNNLAGGSGGAVFVYGDPAEGVGTLLLVDGGSRIDNNTATRPYSRGGVMASRQTLIEITVSDGSSISGNSAGSGGAFHVEQSVGVLTVGDGSCLCRSTARDENGGAVCVEGRLQTVKVYGNSSVSYNNASKAHGGAIFVRGSLSTLAVSGGSSLASNSAGQRGGAVFVDGATFNGQATEMNVTVEGQSHLSNNSADTGGALAATRAVQAVVVTNSSVTGNAARKGNGGAVYVEQTLSALVISDGARVSGNSARLRGGGVYVNGGFGRCTIQNHSSVDGNTATGDRGGGIAVQGSLSELLISDGSSVSGNVADADLDARGAGVWVGTNLDRLTITGGSSIAENIAKRGGSALYVDRNVTSIRVLDGSCICSNLAGQQDGWEGTADAGAVHVLGRLEELTVTGGSRISNNTSSFGSAFGGAVRAHAGIGDVLICNRSAMSHNVGGYGGAIYVPDPPRPAGSTDDVAAIRSFRLCGASNMSGNVAHTVGGAMYVLGKIGSLSIVEGSRVCDNIGMNMAGGIYVSRFIRSLVIRDSTASNNTAWYEHAGFLFQAAYNGGTQGNVRNLADGPYLIDISGSTFESNYAWKNGGVLYLYYDVAVQTVDDLGLREQLQRNATLDIRIANSTFRNNSVGTGSGGALFLTNALNYVDVPKPATGRAVAGRLAHVNLAVNLAIADSTFSSNSVNTFKDRFPYSDVSSTLLGHGGAIFVWSKPYGQLAGEPYPPAGSGGAGLSNTSVPPAGAAGADLYCTSRNSSAWESAAPWPALSYSCRVGITGTTVTGNSATSGYGGGVTTASKPVPWLVIEASSFESNVAADGGGLFLEVNKTSVFLQSCNVSRNRAAGGSGGGALLLVNSTSGSKYAATFIDVQLSGNDASVNGGAMSVQLATPGAAMSVHRVEAFENRATAGGGVAWSGVLGTELLIREAAVHDNVALKHGGGFYLMPMQHPDGGWIASGDSLPPSAASPPSFQLVSSSVLRNRAGYAGGGAHAYLSRNTSITVKNTTLDHNTAVYGGALFVDGEPLSSAQVAGCSLDGNVAQLYGGGLFVVNTKGVKVVANDSVLSGNSAALGGGAISLSGAIDSAAGAGSSSSSRNTTQRARVLEDAYQAILGDGGGVAGSPQAAKTSTSADCTAAASSTTVRTAVSGWSVLLDGLKVYGNTAAYGGGVYLDTGAVAWLNATVLERNAATLSGGAIASVGCELLRVAGCSLYGNTARMSGGGVYSDKCAMVLVEDSDFTSNRAPTGGAFHLAGVNGTSPPAAAAAAAAAVVAVAATMAAAAAATVGATPAAIALLSGVLIANNTAEGPYSIDGSDDAVVVDILTQAYGGHGGGLFISGLVGVAIANSLATGDNRAAVGSVIATTQTCLPGADAGAGSEAATATSELPVSGAITAAAGAALLLGPWMRAALALRQATSQQCSLLVISESHVAKGQGSGSQDGNATALQASASGVVQVAGAAENRTGAPGGSGGAGGGSRTDPLPAAPSANSSASLLVVAPRASFQLDLQLYDALGQPVLVDIPAYRLAMSIRPAANGTAKAGLAYLRKSRVNAAAALSATTSYGRAVFADLDIVGWPGLYALDVTAEVEGTANAALSKAGQELDLDDAPGDADEPVYVCRDCKRDRVGLWVDSRPPYSELYDKYGMSGPRLKKAMADMVSGLLPGDNDDACASCCRNCPTDASCPGGPLLVPAPGFWHSAANSLTMHRCPQPSACGADIGVGEGEEAWSEAMAAALTDAGAAGRANTNSGAASGSLSAIIPAQLSGVNFSTLLLDGRSKLLGKCQQWWYSNMLPEQELARIANGAGSGGLLARAGGLQSMSPGNQQPPCRLDAPSDDPISYMSLQCAPGYSGPLCATCQPGFSMASDFGCNECPTLWRTIFFGLLTFAITTGLILLTTACNMTKSRADAISADTKESSFVDLLKAVITHAQYYIIVTKLGVSFPTVVTAYEKALSILTGAENYVSYSPSCLFNALNSTGQAVVSVLFGLGTPCLISVVAMGLWAVRYAQLHQGRLTRSDGRAWRTLQAIAPPPASERSLSPPAKSRLPPARTSIGSSAGGGAEAAWTVEDARNHVDQASGPITINGSRHHHHTSGKRPGTGPTAATVGIVMSAGPGIPASAQQQPTLAAGDDAPSPGSLPQTAGSGGGSDVRSGGSGRPPLPVAGSHLLSPFAGAAFVGSINGDSPAGNRQLHGTGSHPHQAAAVATECWAKEPLQRWYSNVRSRLNPYHMLMFADQSLSLPQQLGVMLMVATFVLYPTLCQVSLSMFACYKIDPGTGPFGGNERLTWPRGYWVRDMQQACYDGQHLRLYVPLGMASVLVFCLGPPVAAFVTTWRVRDRLQEMRTRIMYGFLYQEFKPQYHWWSSVKQLQTLLLVAVEVFGRVLTVMQQALLLLAVLILIAGMNMTCTPSDLPEIALLEFLSCCVLSQTIILGLYSMEGSDGTVQTLIGAIILGINLAFIAGSLGYAFWHPATSLAGKAASTVTDLIAKLSRSVSGMSRGLSLGRSVGVWVKTGGRWGSGGGGSSGRSSEAGAGRP